MPKILSQSGTSLADVYDVEGSIAGIEQLDTRELGIIHEMGATIFSERFATSIRQADTTVNQSATFDVQIAVLPNVPCRVIGIQVITDDGSRLARVAVHVRSVPNAQDMPIWVWDTSLILPVRIDMGAGNVEEEILGGSPGVEQVPTFAGGSSQVEFTERIVMRGASNAFGAGTVKITVLAQIAFAEISGISSVGLPIPSW